jgi:hypothetical protein
MHESGAEKRARDGGARKLALRWQRQLRDVAGLFVIVGHVEKRTR